MWGIGASLDVEDDGGEIPESGFNDSVSSLGAENDFECMADEDLLVFDLSAEDAGFIIGGEGMGDSERGFSGISGGVNASSRDSYVESGDFERAGCRPPSPLAIADNRSPSPTDVLRYRTAGGPVSAAS